MVVDEGSKGSPAEEESRVDGLQPEEWFGVL